MASPFTIQPRAVSSEPSVYPYVHAVSHVLLCSLLINALVPYTIDERAMQHPTPRVADAATHSPHSVKEPLSTALHRAGGSSDGSMVVVDDGATTVNEESLEWRNWQLAHCAAQCMGCALQHAPVEHLAALRQVRGNYPGGVWPL